MVRNAFTRAQNHTSRAMSIADAVNVPAHEPEPAVRQEPHYRPDAHTPASAETQPAQKLRRTSIQLDDAAYVALKTAAAEHQVPLWAIVNEAIHASLMEDRRFDWGKAGDVAASVGAH